VIYANKYIKILLHSIANNVILMLVINAIFNIKLNNLLIKKIKNKNNF